MLLGSKIGLWSHAWATAGSPSVSWTRVMFPNELSVRYSAVLMTAFGGGDGPERVVSGPRVVARQTEPQFRAVSA
jgi:hypothetical protein